MLDPDRATCSVLLNCRWESFCQLEKQECRKLNLLGRFRRSLAAVAGLFVAFSFSGIVGWNVRISTFLFYKMHNAYGVQKHALCSRSFLQKRSVGTAPILCRFLYLRLNELSAFQFSVEYKSPHTSTAWTSTSMAFWIGGMVAHELVITWDWCYYCALVAIASFVPRSSSGISQTYDADNHMFYVPLFSSFCRHFFS